MSQPSAVACSFFLRGNCRRGDTCRFQHVQETTPCANPSTDRTKDAARSATPCTYYLSGYCYWRDKCWYKHQSPTEKSASRVSEEAMPEEDADTKPDVCGICFEVPAMYGLLDACEHVFCLECIRSWRGVREATDELRRSKVTRLCPICRRQSDFIIPSSIYLKGEGKTTAYGSYRKSMSRIRCKYFEASNGTTCLHGNECFFNHDDSCGIRVQVTRPAERRRRPHALHFNGTVQRFLPINFFSTIWDWEDHEGMLLWLADSSDYDSQEEGEHEIFDEESDIESADESYEGSSEADEASDFDEEACEYIEGGSNDECESDEQASHHYRIGVKITSESESDGEEVEEDSYEPEPDELHLAEGEPDEDGVNSCLAPVPVP